MNIGRVYTPAIFIARGIDSSTGGIGARDEYWKGVHPSNIQGVHPSNIHREGYRPLDRGYRGAR